MIRTCTRYLTDVFAHPSSKLIQPLLSKAKLLNAGLSGIAVCHFIAARATRTMHGCFAADMQRLSYTIFYSPQQEVYLSMRTILVPSPTVVISRVGTPARDQL